MSGVYWGIVAGVAAMVAVFFVCMDLVYSNQKGSLRQSGRSEKGPNEPTRQTAARDRYAA